MSVFLTGIIYNAEKICSLLWPNKLCAGMSAVPADFYTGSIAREFKYIGKRVVIYPMVKLIGGKYIPDYSIAVGAPAKIIKLNLPEVQSK